MTMPSRRFFVEQSCLCAAAKEAPYLIEQPHLLSSYLEGRFSSAFAGDPRSVHGFVDNVRKEYRRLMSYYTTGELRI